MITVRRPRWDLPGDLDEVFSGDLSEACSRVAFSLVLPHLEPYLIRTMRSIAPRISDPALAAQVEAFCGQEAQHHRGHASFNRYILREVGPETAARLQRLEQRLHADYRRFSETRSPRFNAAYAEGFEAMTCAMALTNLARGRPMPDNTWQQLWLWHLAEELEHRTVAFDVYRNLGGSLPYRVIVGAFAQLHFLRHLDALYRILMRHHGRRVVAPHVPVALRRGWRRHLATFSPTYDPARIAMPRSLEEHLATL